MQRKIIVLIAAFAVVILVGYFVNQKVAKTPSPAVSSPSPSPSVNASAEPSPSLSATPKANLPSTYLIENFPFQSQAPLGNWDTLHEESCEEASLILVKYWQDGKQISAQEMEDEIQKMVAWENENGYPQDITVAQVAQIAVSYYEMKKPQAEYGINIKDIKENIAQNRPVIIPAAGRLLGNPYFTAPGPVYHMVAAIGYNGNNIIVQDVGTRRGNNYTYNQEIFLNAIHDWAGSKDNIETGRKAMLVF